MTSCSVCRDGYIEAVQRQSVFDRTDSIFIFLCRCSRGQWRAEKRNIPIWGPAWQKEFETLESSLLSTRTGITSEPSGAKARIEHTLPKEDEGEPWEPPC